MFDIADENNQTFGAKIKVIGVGGGGCNAVNTMIRSGLQGVEYIVANTDSQALVANLAGTKIQLGGNVTKGLGAGANPEVGRKAAIEDYERISEALVGADMIFITAGMGGGTGTGAAPVIAKLAREMGALTVGVVTKPFVFEGKKRSRQAEEGIRSLEESVDSLICIPNQRLLQLAGENLSLVDTFKAADEVLLNAVQGISDLINNTGLINADFADVSTVMTNKGLSLMGTGSASGTERALKAARQAISSPLLEDVSIDGATGIIINITGNSSLTTHETNQAVTLIMEAADDDAEIIFGTVIDETMGDFVKVTVIATGLRTARKEAAVAAYNHAHMKIPAHAPIAAYEAPPSIPVRPHAQAPVSTPKVEAEQPATPVQAKVEEAPKLPEAAPVQAQPQTQAPVAAASAPAQPTVSRPTLAEEAQELSRKLNETLLNKEASLEFEREEPKLAEKPKINWAEKLQSAASKYESQKNTFDHREPMNLGKPAQAERPEYTHYDTSEPAPAQPSAQNRESRIKSIAEKLGFFNFDEDEFDTPSFIKKNERNHDTQM